VRFRAPLPQKKIAVKAMTGSRLTSWFNLQHGHTFMVGSNVRDEKYNQSLL
jgi:hypothetical protein